MHSAVRSLTCLCLLLALGACSPKPASQPATPYNPLAPGLSDNAAILNTGIDLGDVEATTQFEARLAERSQAANVEANEVENMLNKLTLATITLREPFPESLWLALSIDPKEDYSERPLVLRSAVSRDKEVFERFGTVLGENTALPRNKEKTTKWPTTFEVDALKGLEEIPETLLVHAIARAELTDQGTDESTLDPASPAPKDITFATISSNPVRINFERAQQP